MCDPFCSSKDKIRLNGKYYIQTHLLEEFTILYKKYNLAAKEAIKMYNSISKDFLKVSGSFCGGKNVFTNICPSNCLQNGKESCHDELGKFLDVIFDQHYFEWKGPYCGIFIDFSGICMPKE